MSVHLAAPAKVCTNVTSSTWTNDTIVISDDFDVTWNVCSLDDYIADGGVAWLAAFGRREEV